MARLEARGSPMRVSTYGALTRAAKRGNPPLLCTRYHPVSSLFTFEQLPKQTSLAPRRSEKGRLPRPDSVTDAAAVVYVTHGSGRIRIIGSELGAL